jgi:hypothetical protein
LPSHQNAYYALLPPTGSLCFFFSFSHRTNEPASCHVQDENSARHERTHFRPRTRRKLCATETSDCISHVLLSTMHQQSPFQVLKRKHRFLFTMDSLARSANRSPEATNSSQFHRLEIIKSRRSNFPTARVHPSVGRRWIGASRCSGSQT